MQNTLTIEFPWHQHQRHRLRLSHHHCLRYCCMDRFDHHLSRRRYLKARNIGWYVYWTVERVLRLNHHRYRRMKQKMLLRKKNAD